MVTFDSGEDEILWIALIAFKTTYQINGFLPAIINVVE